MQVIAWSQNLASDVAQAAGATLVSKGELFAKSDYVTIHARLSPRTRDMVGAAELARMKPTAYLVNTSRGPIVNEAALIVALRNRRIRGRGADVFDSEPLAADHPIRTLDNTILLPASRLRHGRELPRDLCDAAGGHRGVSGGQSRPRAEHAGALSGASRLAPDRARGVDHQPQLRHLLVGGGYTISSQAGDDGMMSRSVSWNQRTRGVFCRPADRRPIRASPERYSPSIRSAGRRCAPRRRRCRSPALRSRARRPRHRTSIRRC